MKNHEYYNKHKTKYPSLVNPLFSKKNLWRIALIIVLAVLIEPLIVYRYGSVAPLSLNYYLRMIKYCLFVMAPLSALVWWANWRQHIKQISGYAWVGKFEIIEKHSSFLFPYLLLKPGTDNSIKVEAKLFHKIRVGDFVLVRRDSLWNIEKVIKLNNLSSRLTKAGAKL